MECECCFSLHFSSGQWCWTLFRIFIDHLYFFWEFSIPTFTFPFLSWVFILDGLILWVYVFCILVLHGVADKDFFSFCRLSLYSTDCFLYCIEACYLYIIPFVDSCCYFLCSWNYVQQALAYIWLQIFYLFCLPISCFCFNVSSEIIMIIHLTTTIFSFRCQIKITVV